MRRRDEVRPIFKLEGKRLDYLGGISYGAYVYHLPLIVALYIVTKGNPPTGWMVLFIIVPSTIAFASLS